MGLRGLVYPHFPANQSKNRGYRYVKPPLLKIVMGNANANEKSPFSNLLTYPQTINKDSNKIASLSVERNYKTFIASSVEITKNLDSVPVYIDEDRTLKDTFGFDVSINLVEITPSYSDLYPDQKDYFDQYLNYMSTYEG